MQDKPIHPATLFSWGISQDAICRAIWDWFEYFDNIHLPADWDPNGHHIGTGQWRDPWGFFDHVEFEGYTVPVAPAYV